MPSRDRTWVYILASRKNGSLYIGVTSDLRTRMWQHQTGSLAGFTKKYHVGLLVYLEEYARVRDAIARERALKGWTRRRKIALVESANADWDDLAGGWFEGGLDPSLRSG